MNIYTSINSKGPRRPVVAFNVPYLGIDTRSREIDGEGPRRPVVD